MTAAANHLIDEAMKFSPEERRAIATVLWQSVVVDEPEITLSAEAVARIEQSRRDIREGRASAMDRDEFRNWLGGLITRNSAAD